MANDDVRVLIVDDDPAVRQILAALLHRGGVLADVAPDGEAATAMLRERNYRVVLLDLLMPRLDGQGVLAFMKENGITTPVIVLSAVSDERGTDLDPQLVRVTMQKPLDPRELRTVVNAILERA
jgi:DNA-binding response OmpR family regulator